MSIAARPATAPRAARRPAPAARKAPPAAEAGAPRDARVAAAAPEGRAALPPADRAAYDAVAAQLDAPGRARLAKLLAAGALTATDAHGASLAANLGALTAVAPPAGAPYTARDLLGQALAHLAEPATIDQAGRNTCGATTVQYVLATEQPAEYVRLVAGLAGAGQVALRGGQRMSLPPDAVGRDDTSRDDVERLVQAAFQDYGADFRGRYANQDDTIRHANGAGGGVRGFLRRTLGRAVDWVMAKAGAAKGIAEGKVLGLYRDTTGRQARLVGDLPGGVLVAPAFLRGDVFGEVRKALAAGHRVPVDLVLEGLEDRPGRQVERVFAQGLRNYPAQMASHQVLVTKVAEGRVFYRNPWGYDTSMSEAEFRSRLTDAIIPA